MSKKIKKDINYFIDKYKLLGNNKDCYKDYGVDTGLFYEDFYLLKYFYIKYGLNLDRIINTNSKEEYKIVCDKEINKIKTFYKQHYSSFLLDNIYEGRKEILSYIKKLDLNSFDIYEEGYNWHTSEYLDSIIDFSKCKNILSIFDIFYSKNLNQSTKVEVLAHRIQLGDIYSRIMRLELINNQNYIIEEKQFPFSTDKKYNFIFMTYSYYDIEGIDKGSTIIYDENTHDIKFAGDDPNAIIQSIIDCLTPNGKAVLNIPLYLISKIDSINVGDNHENKNYIEKIVFQPVKKEFVKGEYQESVYVYLVLSKNMLPDEPIEFVNLSTNERKLVSLTSLKNNNYYINFNLYFSHDAKTHKMYNLKNDNIKQKKIIDRETEFIDKLIDEFDFIK